MSADKIKQKTENSEDFPDSVRAKLAMKLEQVVAASEFYDDLNKQLIKDNVELDNVKMKMIFTKKEILKLILEAKESIRELVQ